MIKVLFFVYSLDGGGAEKALIDLVENLDKSKYDITIQAFKDEGVYRDAIPTGVKYRALLRFKHSFLRKVISKLLIKLIHAGLIYRLAVREHYDCEVAFVEGIATRIIANSSNQKSKKIAWVHCDMSQLTYALEDYNDGKEQIEAYKRFDHVVTVSENAVEGFKKGVAPEFDPIVVYNLLNVSKIRQAGLELVNVLSDTDTVELVTVGRLEESKGFGVLLRVFKRLRDDGLKVHLSIIGEGIERRSLEEYVTQHHLNNDVALLGFQKNPYKFLSKADIFVCSSLSEGYSLAVAEALILGKAIVSTRCAGPVELLKNGEYGILVDINEEELYRGVKKMIVEAHTREYFACKARERSRIFDLELQLKEVERLLVPPVFEEDVDELNVKS
ncbi:glycosyltransferase [Desemzia incerta]|uniref:glycosyltransferase n=1 Tax=Desemzia incerta TaxID=82801 RepID=UPI0024C27459|nr:glycosyltransferase [Desemzia incerta]WHZ32901.1 glycosyltransferase [Desemzia incerta]